MPCTASCATIEQLLCMNGGEGQASYAKNSFLQRSVMSSTRHILEESVMDVCNTFSSSNYLAVADLGCATGPNAIVAASEIVNIVGRAFNDDDDVMGHNNNKCPYLVVYFNDLPSNDFNAIFRTLAAGFINSPFGRDQCFVMAVPGSFYGRLFPCRSLHLVHSSYALQWLSQVPKRLMDENGEALNKGNICLAQTSSLAVQKAYADQFKQDFNAFLKSRSEELRPGGSMVMTILGNAKSNSPFEVMEVIGMTLDEMAKEGMIEESKLDMFNLPVYAASQDEIREVILDEGSFDIRELKVIKTRWDAGMDEKDEISVVRKDTSRGDFVAKYLRAVVEALLVAGFGEGVVDEVFGRVAVKFEELMNAGDCHYASIAVWLTRNG